MNAKTRQAKIRALSARYPRVIELSKADAAFVGSAPPLVGQCGHGDTEIEVVRQLALIVEDLAADVIDMKMPVAEPPVGRTCSGKFVVRISPDLHRPGRAASGGAR
jgi:predicted HicB family RNase H-like nuclease